MKDLWSILRHCPEKLEGLMKSTMNNTHPSLRVAKFRGFNSYVQATLAYISYRQTKITGI
jgi:hypothetical protein